MQKSEATLKLLKEACEIALLSEPEFLEGKTIEFSEKCGTEHDVHVVWKEVRNVSEGKVKVLIQRQRYSSDQYVIAMSDNISCLGSLEETIRKNIKEKFGSNAAFSLVTYGEDDPVIWFATI